MVTTARTLHCLRSRACASVIGHSRGAETRTDDCEGLDRFALMAGSRHLAVAPHRRAAQNPSTRLGPIPIVSVLVAVAAAIENVFHFGDNWRNYRQALEALKREPALFDAKVGAYADPQTAFATFVERCEGIMAQETGSYFDAHKEQVRPQVPPEVR